ncbi:MAG: hypothetical protein ACTSSP_04845, partial [Candidatus Asgardarchaeia archaeon]
SIFLFFKKNIVDCCMRALNIKWKVEGQIMRRVSFYKKVSFFYIVLIIISEVMIYSPTLTTTVNFKILYYDRNSTTYEINTYYFPLDLNVIFFSSNNQQLRNIFIYYDEAYQVAGVTRKCALGIVSQLPVELKIRNYSGEVFIINATTLRDLLQNLNTANQSILIVTTGAFPDTVYSKEENIVKPWVEAGGILVWMGDTLGFYSATMSKERLNYSDPKHPKEDGLISFFGSKSIIIPSKWGSVAFNDSTYSKALALKYSFISRGVNITEVELRGGKILGKITSSVTSIASIPLKKGNIIIFGGEALDARTISKDIAQIISSGVLFSDDLIFYKNYKLSRWMVIVDSVYFNDTISEIIIYVFQVHTEGTYYKKIFLFL